MKSVRPADWAYLAVSFLLSLWLIEAQRKDMNLSDFKVSCYWGVAKFCRRLRLVVLDVEKHAIDLCNEELERRV